MLMYAVFWWALLMPVVLLVCLLFWRSGRWWVGRAAVWGCIIGLAGFALGFFGPLLWAPDANQGPLLGIFFTGPLAFAATATTVLIVGAFKSRRVAAA